MVQVARTDFDVLSFVQNPLSLFSEGIVVFQGYSHDVIFCFYVLFERCLCFKKSI